MKVLRAATALFIFVLPACRVQTGEEPPGPDEYTASVDFHDAKTGLALRHPSWMLVQPGENAYVAETKLVPKDAVDGYRYVISLRRETGACRDAEPGEVPPGYGFLEASVGISGVAFPRVTDVVTTPEWKQHSALYQAQVGADCVGLGITETYDNFDARNLPEDKRFLAEAQRKEKAGHIIPNFRAMLQSARLPELEAPAAAAAHVTVPGTLVDLRKLAGLSREAVKAELGAAFENPDVRRQGTHEEIRGYTVGGGELTITYYRDAAYRLEFKSPVVTRSAAEAIRQIGFDVSGRDPAPGSHGHWWSGDFGAPVVFKTVRAVRADSDGNFNGGFVEVDTRARR